ncbi:serine protease Do-like HtrA [Variibacter gotjawalensis]|uniref:Serine protease Do-like HtrA n=1 Tax=Variibacter gotjawalensis TaxID=1333996 RepID=A0A0S3PX87_9BRAD|nr:S1C family serine protease [Variibacter gotjawalensis]NIK46369.1 S1-C subfamily serine protease [Variibacter gotjawalensis]RZS48279.1 S1-C subfamily serine protease [Variibacter gotjawalensis]BAT60539.1 serine protease Do-like HtrA [Variibacter gotjawalensis]
MSDLWNPVHQPQPQDYTYDLERALNAIVGVHSVVPPDAFTAETLGTERAGNGVLIAPHNVVLTIGYLVTEAEQVWLHFNGGKVVPGHVMAYDQETGFGLIQPLARIDAPALELGSSASTTVGDDVVVAGAGGRSRSVAARIAAKQEFAGYWEYVLDEAIFTTPSHPNWGGTGLIGADGKLIGIGSLQLEQTRGENQTQHINMVVPIDLLKPILNDLMTLGRPNRPVRPWLGLFATEIESRVVIAGLAGQGPAKRANLKTGDLVVSVAGREVTDLASLFRGVWSLGEAGVEVPLRVHREGRTFDVRITSSDRNSFLKRPKLH